MGHTQMKTNKKVELPTALRGMESSKLTKKRQASTFFMHAAIRFVGLMLVTISGTMYAQLVPLTLVFMGGYLGIQPDATINQMDTLIWALTGIALLVPMGWIFIRWLQFVWTRFILNPARLYRKPSFPHLAK